MKKRKLQKKCNKTNNFKELPRIAALLGVSGLAIIAFAPSASAFNFMNALTYIQQKLDTERTNDAFKVFTAQDSVSNSVLSETSVLASQKLATAEVQLNLKQKVLDTYANFVGPNALSTNSKCNALADRENDTLAVKKSDVAFKSDTLSMLNAGNYGSEMDRRYSLSDMRNKLTCTNELSKMGFCDVTVTGAQYFDTDFSFIGSEREITENQFMATQIGVLSIANPIKDQSLIENCEGDTACAANIQRNDRTTAVSSLVVNSLLSKAYDRVKSGGTYE